LRIDTWVTVSPESDRAREGAAAFAPPPTGPMLEVLAGILSDEFGVRPSTAAAAAVSPTLVVIGIIVPE